LDVNLFPERLGPERLGPETVVLAGA